MADRQRDFLDDYLDRQHNMEDEPMDESAQRTAFYESAPADVTSRRLAYLAAKDAGAIDADGKGDWPAIRKAYPDLFRTAPPKSPAPVGNPMEAALRAANAEKQAAAADLILGRPSSLTRKVEGK